MSVKELKRLHLIAKLDKKEIFQEEAGKILKLSSRQIRRLLVRFRCEGEQGLKHRLRGTVSNFKRPEKERKEILKIYQERYKGFGPTFASEKFSEEQGIKISCESLRQILIAEGIWIKKRSRKAHREWRERKAYFGEMLQMDGSEHDWLEGRGPRMVLMGYIDDATGNAYGKFYSYEGTQPAMESFYLYTKKYGVPHSIYFDRHSTYKNNTAKLTIEDQLNDREPLSEFSRALKEIGVQFIHAHSPQAKGRIERSFNTHQDRLVKEMRLAEINTMEEANTFLEKYYWNKHNRKFAVAPANPSDLHQKVYSKSALQRALCKRTLHPLRNDRTLVHNKQWYQVESFTIAKSVTVEERYDGKMFVVDRDKPLRFKSIPKPAKEKLRIKGRFKPCGHKPAENNYFNRPLGSYEKYLEHQKDWDENYVTKLVENF